MPLIETWPSQINQTFDSVIKNGRPVSHTSRRRPDLSAGITGRAERFSRGQDWTCRWKYLKSRGYGKNKNDKLGSP